MSWLFGGLFGGSGRSDNQPATTTQQRTRRDTLTDASSVARAFGSGDPSQIEDIMRRHEVRVTNSAAAKNETQLFKVTQQKKVLTREDSSGDLHAMHTFHLSAGAKRGDDNTFHGTYFPMTARATGWSNQGRGQQFQSQDAIVTRQQSDIAMTTPLTACFVTDSDEGIGHTQPYEAPKVDPKTTSVEQEALHYRQHNANAQQVLEQQHTDVFGPNEYGKYYKQGGRGFRAATAIVMADKTGQKHIMAQSIYGSNFGSSPQDQIVKFTSRPFGRPPQAAPGITVTPAQGTAAPMPAVGNNKDFLTPPAPKRPPRPNESRPQSTRRRQSIATDHGQVAGQFSGPNPNKTRNRSHTR